MNSNSESEFIAKNIRISSESELKSSQVKPEVKDFDQLLSEATDETIKHVFGKNTSELIHELFEKHISTKHEEVDERIEVFYTYLEKLIGSESTKVVQNTSFKSLFRKVKAEYTEVEKHFSFLDELYKIKMKLLTSSHGDRERSEYS